MRNIAGLTIFMTGASGGIGGATARLVAKPGVKLAICSIDEPELNALTEELREKGAEVFARVVNVRSEDEVSAFIQDGAKALGGADILINFAGLSVTAPVRELTEEAFDRIMEVNVKGVFLAIKHFMGFVDTEKGAQIINFGSMAATRPNPASPQYSAAKAAVNMFTESLSQQLKASNIRLTTINPGPTDTPFFAGRMPKEKTVRFMRAEDVAEVLQFVLTRDERIVFHNLQFESFDFFKG